MKIFCEILKVILYSKVYLLIIQRMYSSWSMIKLAVKRERCIWNI
jgi:hypothetical protein